ncbi:MAG: hypothetical protein N0A16_02745 [Blastocatellia bacterium]|nr:hypothetical protein [Blastocatellia bacterium]MCS7156633.1 hypothetical protein [Blastocatellia bacterium]MCX7751625.1 hypothetical protein [Blastocatellia bacterium]MDW8168725.1 hypothetical protein [Acidobacteriota bacterium]MDW8256991.1 hypothetical protein [Acidobacteriota bacterium]
MGAGTRAQELRQRRHRKLKRRKQRLHELFRLLEQGRTHEERVKIAQEFWQKVSGTPTPPRWVSSLST